MYSLNGFVVVTVHDVRRIEDATEHDSTMAEHVTFESPDARIHGRCFKIPEPLREAFKFAELGWKYCVQFKKGELYSAILLQQF